jgi:flagellar motor switch protein FliM
MSSSTSMGEALDHRNDRTKSDIQAAIENGSGRLDRFVGLADRLAQGAKKSAERLSEMLGTMPSVSVLEMKPLRAGDFTSACSPGGLFSVIVDADVGGHILLHVDSDCVAVLVERSLGGRLPSSSMLPRAYSKIDNGIVRLAARRLACSLAEVLFRENALHVDVNEVGESLDSKAVGLERRPIAFARFRLSVDDKFGVVSIGIGHEMLEVLTIPTVAVPAPRDAGGDLVWTRHFERHAAESRAGLVAVMEERLVQLSEIAAMRVGDVLQLRATTSSPVRVECAEIPVMLCRLGKTDNAFALRIEGFVDQQFDFLAVSSEEM